MRNIKVLKIDVPYVDKTILSRMDKPFKSVLLEEMENILIEMEYKMKEDEKIPENLVRITAITMDEDTYLMTPKKI